MTDQKPVWTWRDAKPETQAQVESETRMYVCGKCRYVGPLGPLHQDTPNTFCGYNAVLTIPPPATKSVPVATLERWAEVMELAATELGGVGQAFPAGALFGAVSQIRALIGGERG